MPTAVITESSEKMSVDHHDLQQGGGESRHAPRARGGDLVLALERAMHLVGRLPHQEQSAAEQDQVAAGDLVADDAEQRFGEVA
jgi:hypothetical protein